MNVKLVESLAQIVLSLTPEERALLEEKLQANPNEPSKAGENRFFMKPPVQKKGLKHFGSGRKVTPATAPLYRMKPLVFTETEVN